MAATFYPEDVPTSCICQIRMPSVSDAVGGCYAGYVETYV